mmetsp:Transcript_20747/g.46194  ORF Transcript_20747/g.46194 Transcript_20747/m.46194 type:complete len:230 (+) Transcript_20747:573-1262(+)
MALFALRLFTSPNFSSTGFLRNSLASFTISLGHVAVKNMVCLLAGIFWMIWRICGSKPISSMRSASSRTRNMISARLTTRISSRSLSLPGVAISTSTPAWILRICNDFGAPPYAQTERMLDVRPNFTDSSSIWQASSRVGASTRMAGEPRLRPPANAAISKWNAGSRKPQVLPEPVFATVIMSRPARAMGQESAWVGVGPGKPASSRALRTGAEKGVFSNFMMGSGQVY